MRIGLAIPLDKGARLSLEMEGSTKVNTQWRVAMRENTRSLPPYRLCARHVSLKSQRGKPLELLDVKGEGNFVGLTFGLEGTFQKAFAMLEGDEIIEVDDDPKLRMQGTGTEDTFNSSWYFPDRPFSLPFHGLTHKSKDPIRVSAYRWFIADAIPFKKRLRFLFEHGGRNNTEGIAYQAVLFWYQRP